jgi:RNA recognition motif-containing protein
MAFETYGLIESAKIIKDKSSGQSKGFGFVDMPAKIEAQRAINGMNGRGLKGKTITVDEARSRSGNLRERKTGRAYGFYWASTDNN